jgi:hypothetical protein
VWNDMYVGAARSLILIENLRRKYYGKKYHRSASDGEGGRTQARLTARQSRAKQGRLSQSETRVGSSPENKIEEVDNG